MPTATSPTTSRSGLLRAYLALSILLSVLVLLQAWMAGNALFVGDIEFFLHGMVGNVGSYLVAVAILVITIVARATKVAMIHAVAIVALMTVQIGLGYAGREVELAASLHVPLGVLIFGLTITQISQARGLKRGESAA